MVIAILTSGYILTTTSLSPIIYLSCLAGITLFIFKTLPPVGRVHTKKFHIVLKLLAPITLLATATLVLNATPENIISQLKLGLALTFGAVLFLSFSFQCFAKSFSAVIFFVCIVSLPGYVLSNLTDLLSGLPSISNVNGVDYKFAFIFASFEGFLSYRNIGIFWEPGIFASMIFCSLVADLFLSENSSTKRTVVLLITLATTFSSAGLILLALYLGLLVSHKRTQNTRLKKARLLLPFVTLGIVYCFIFLTIDSDSTTYSNFTRLLEKILDLEEAQSTRLLSPITSFSVFTEKPLFGWGLSSALEQYTAINHDIALTSTSIYLLSALGISGLFFTAIPLIGVFRIEQTSILTRTLLAISYLFIVNKEPHTYFTLTHTLIYFLLAAALKKNQRSNHMSVILCQQDQARPKNTQRIRIGKLLGDN